MRAKSFTVTGSANGPTFSPVFVVDTYNVPTNIGIHVAVSGLLAIADVQSTTLDPLTINLNTLASANVWITHSTLTSATQANGAIEGSYLFPVTAIRGRVRALASASVGETATFRIVQAGAE